jgi:hypothetical protein
MKSRALLCLVVVLVLAGCDRRDNDPDRALGPHDPPLAVMTIGNLAAPESALHDAESDVYLISNINGGFLDRDNNGFISRVHPDTGKVDLKWIEGGKNGVTLHAPKGMAIQGNLLYVSDITAIRKFDRKTGAQRGEIAIPNATFLNDLASDGENIYLSDTGITPAEGDRFAARGTDAIWRIRNDRAERVAAGRELHQPNGLVMRNGALHAVAFAGNALYRLDDGKRADIVTLPDGQLDGVVALPGGDFLVSSWLGQAVYRQEGDHFVKLLAGINAPADIGYDEKRKRLLLPRPNDNQVTVHEVE